MSSITLLLSIHCVKTKIDIIADSYHLETALCIWVRIQSQSANTFAHDYFYTLQEISLKFSAYNVNSYSCLQMTVLAYGNRHKVVITNKQVQFTFSHNSGRGDCWNQRHISNYHINSNF